MKDPKFWNDLITAFLMRRKRVDDAFEKQLIEQAL
jgi:hypothetical protein